MHVQVRTSDGRIYDVDVDETAQIHDLLGRLFAPNPVPRNSSIMARTRLLDSRERVANVMHNDLFLVGPKPDVVHIQRQQQQQQQQQSMPSPGSSSSSSAKTYHHHQQKSHHSHSHHAHQEKQEFEHAKHAVHHLEEMVASPELSNQPTFQPFQGAPPPPPAPQQQQQQQPNCNNASNVPLPAQYQQQQPQHQHQKQQQQHHHHGHHHHHRNQHSHHHGGHQHQQHQQQTSASSPPPQEQQQPNRTPPPQKKPMTHAETLIFVRENYTVLHERAHSDGASDHDRLVVGEESMRLLYKLDALDDIGPELKVERKRLVKEIQALQDWIDSAKGKK